MKLSKEHILELFKQLPTDTVCDYVIPGNFTVKIKPVIDNDIHFTLYENGVEAKKDVPLTESAMEVMANSITENTPISIDSALVNGGNKRSAIEGALIRTSEFYSIKIGRNKNKNIVWVPSKPHPIGEKGLWDEKEELPVAPFADNLQMAVNQSELRDDYSIKELGKQLASMIKEEQGKNTVVTCTAFGLKYGKSIIRNEYKAKDLIDEANKFGTNIDHAQDGAVNNGKSLYDIISKRKFGFHFSNKENWEKARECSFNTFSPYLTALRTKPFMLLAGISGTGKSRIVRKLAQASITEKLQKIYDPKSVEKGFNRWELHKPANFELVQVKPNWHNSLEVVGYKSNIGSPHYEFTPFVEFVARAWKHQDVPFFLCLDEMNLAPVEQYFAEFLSAIESRSIENGEYETDPIIKPFSEFDTRDDNGNVTDKLSDRMIAKLIGKLDTQTKSDLADRFRTKGLTLPKNLLVLGTVNMDETTFSFSRKVLDRAMSIVMNDVEYDKFFTGETENDMAEFDDATKELLIDRPIRGLEAESNGAEQVEQYLTAINEVLNETPFKLGYRAANEALLYVSAAHQFDSSIDVNSALDEFTLMKILSRIEGDKRSIENLLNDLQRVINESYPASNKKLVQMAKTLQNKQFVSYWT